MWNVKCEMWNVKCEMWNVKCEMWNVKCEMWNVKCEMWNVKCEMWNVKVKVSEWVSEWDTVDAPWCSAVVLSRSPLTVSSQAACLLGSLSNWRLGGLPLWCWLRDWGVLLRTAVDNAQVFPFFVTEDDCTLDANVLPVLLFTFYDDSSSSIRISPFLAESDRIPRPGGEQHISHPGIPVLQHPDPPPPDIHMTPQDDPLAPVPRDLTAFNITIP